MKDRSSLQAVDDFCSVETEPEFLRHDRGLDLRRGKLQLLSRLMRDHSYRDCPWPRRLVSGSHVTSFSIQEFAALSTIA